jgi:hypothetical protein
MMPGNTGAISKCFKPTKLLRNPDHQHGLSSCISYDDCPWLLSGGHAAGSVKRGARFSRLAFSASTWFGLPIRCPCSVVSAMRPARTSHRTAWLSSRLAARIASGLPPAGDDHAALGTLGLKRQVPSASRSSTVVRIPNGSGVTPRIQSSMRWTLTCTKLAFARSASVGK